MTTDEEKAIHEAIAAARKIQEFLWGKANGEWGWEEWKRMFRKRVAKLEEVLPSNPHAVVEARKRLLQQAALSIAMMAILDRTQELPKATSSTPSNLPQFACRCHEISASMVDGHPNPEGANEFRESWGHYEECPAFRGVK